MKLGRVCCGAVLWGVLSSQILAAPSLAVNFLPPDAAGRFRWQLGVVVDPSLFTSPSEGELPGSYVSIDAGFRFTGGAIHSYSVNSVDFPQDAAGYSIFGDETPDDMGEYKGVQLGTNSQNLFVSLESNFITTGGFREILTVTTHIMSLSSPYTSVVWGGAYDASGTLVDSELDSVQLGTHAAILQGDGGGGIVQAEAGKASFNATVGDTNLTDGVSLKDLNTVLYNFGRSGTTWREGNFNGDATTALSDLGAVMFNFGAASGEVIYTPYAPPAATFSQTVPEPQTIWLTFPAVLGLGYRLRR